MNTNAPVTPPLPGARPASPGVAGPGRVGGASRPGSPGPAPGSIGAPGGAEELRGIKPPVEIANPWLWVWWGLAVAAILAMALVAWQRWRRRALLAPPIEIIPPHVRARKRLEEALLLLSDPNRFCTQVADAIRTYLEERFQLRAPERTTEEFLLELQGSRHLTPDQKQSLGLFLQSCDLVKFARLEPNETTLRQLHEAALRLIDETQFDSLALGPGPGQPAPSSAPTSVTS